MGTNRAHTLILEIDVCRSAQCLFKAVCTDQRSGTIVFILLAYLLWDVNPGIGLVQFLAAQFLCEYRIQVFRFQWLLSGWMDRRHRFVHHVGLDVVPLSWDLILWEEIPLDSLFHNFFSFRFIIIH